jgi:hypothetical protein
VAKLVNVDNHYLFGYTHGAQVSENFTPFGSMHDLSSLYVSDELFPIFANRAMNEKRPEFSRYSRWAGLDEKSDPLGLMARIGGIRATDALQVSPVPERSEDGKYRTVFFMHGISHLPQLSIERVGQLNPGEILYPMLDVQNPYDKNAVCMRTTDPAVIVGYCPRYIAPDLKFLSEYPSPKMSVTVSKVNIDAPAQFRLLCEAICSWPDEFVPCSTVEHKLISPISVEEALNMISASKPFQRRVG